MLLVDSSVIQRVFSQRERQSQNCASNCAFISCKHVQRIKTHSFSTFHPYRRREALRLPLQH